MNEIYVADNPELFSLTGLEGVTSLGVLDVEVVLGVLVPGQRDDPVDVVADDRGLGAHRRHHLELLELLESSLARLGGHRLGLDLVLELVELVLEFVAVAELLLNGLHLLIQVVLLLRLLHLLLDAGPDLLLHLEDLDLGLHQLVEALEALAGRRSLEELLLVLQLERDVRELMTKDLRQLVRAGAGGHVSRYHDHFELRHGHTRSPLRGPASRE